ncbi:MAG TPA: outer membrane protein assembly factor BamD [Bryobacteraceae bacterium]|nr:outer membrane protein assembly factor BamD [Bryobacteraceae bacterium]
MQRRNPILVLTASFLAILLLSGFFPFRKKKYETPISKDTLQPDKILFDRAIKNIEKGNYEVARLTLNTLINTYDTSEYLAKAKLAIADSWYREGGAHGLAQAEAEYKDFILFYPNMQEAAESQYKVCEIHYKQMEKADRDSAQATRAEDECRQVLKQFPNAEKFVKKAEQMLRNVQEVLAEKEYRAGDFYHHKGSFPAAASRFTYLTRQYPLYSGSDEALWEEADSYRHMGDRFEAQEGDALVRIVKDYPLSEHVDEAKQRLGELKRAVPQADPAAYARMKYELENRTKPSLLSRSTGFLSGHPDTHLAAKAGAPIMDTVRPSVPVSVPASAAGGQSGVSDVVAGVVADSSNIDKSPDARLSSQNGTVAPDAQGTGEQKASVGSNGQTTTSSNATEVAPPTNHPATAKQIKAYQKAQAKAQAKAAREAKKKGHQAPASATPTQSGTPATTDTTAQNAQPASRTTPTQPSAPLQ